MMKAKIIVSETEQAPITTIKYLIKRILHRSRYNYKLSTNLNLDIDEKRTFVTKIKSKATLKKKSLFLHLKDFSILKITNFIIFLKKTNSMELLNTKISSL